MRCVLPENDLNGSLTHFQKNFSKRLLMLLEIYILKTDFQIYKYPKNTPQKRDVEHVTNLFFIYEFAYPG